jgi:hypothetical protein
VPASSKGAADQTETPAPNTAQPFDRERWLADVDPWSAPIEQFVEAPEENAPAAHKCG